MRYLISILILITTVPAYATTMCAMNDTRAVILDADINGSSYTNDANTMQWTATFPYGKIYGFAACVSNAPSGAMGTTVTSAGTPLEAGGAEREGRYCWCRLTHPVSSLWAFVHEPLRWLRPALRRAARGAVWFGRAGRKLM